MVAKAVIASRAKRSRTVRRPLGRGAAALLAMAAHDAYKSAQIREAA
jgi:hypothetical protein